MPGREPITRLLLGMTLLCAAAGAGSTGAEPALEPLIEAGQGVIFPAGRAADEAIVGRSEPNAVASYWTPTPAIVAELEERLGPFLNQRLRILKTGLASVPWIERSKSPLAAEQQHVSNLLARLGETQRQYVGIVHDGTRRVFVNCFPRESFPDWNRQFVFVLDGGDWFWNVQYEVERRTFVRLAYNGDA